LPLGSTLTDQPSPYSGILVTISPAGTTRNVTSLFPPGDIFPFTRTVPLSFTMMSAVTKASSSSDEALIIY